MTDTIALLSHASPTAIVAYRFGLAVTAQQFLAEARQVAERLPKGNHVLNVCADRYQFTVGLGNGVNPFTPAIGVANPDHIESICIDVLDFGIVE